MIDGYAGVLTIMKYFSRLFLLPVFLLLNVAFANSSFADITKDMRAIMKVFTSQSCAQGIGKLFSENHEILVLLLGDTLVEKNFSPQSAKQLKFKLLLDEQKNKIHKFDAPIIIQILNFKNSEVCRFDYEKIKDPVLNAWIRSYEQARKNMINDIKNSRVTYADVANLLRRENSQSEQILMYWLEKDPNAENKLMNDLSKMNNAMQKMIQPMARTLRREYDLSL
ncbi:hypothetical protein N9535_02415 [Amylibacter sp.]|nr:hypothetical protein [Amylibacter sp.]